MKLTRYWLEFAEPAESLFIRSFGVTAWNHNDALNILMSRISDYHQLRPTKRIDGVDINTLDPNHVLPNMGVFAVRGIWFPKHYQ